MILGIKNLFNIFLESAKYAPKNQPGPWPIVFLFSVSFWALITDDYDGDILHVCKKRQYHWIQMASKFRFVGITTTSKKPNGMFVSGCRVVKSKQIQWLLWQTWESHLIFENKTSKLPSFKRFPTGQWYGIALLNHSHGNGAKIIKN